MDLLRSLSVCALACALTSPAASANWRLTFADNFDGTAINSTKWNTAYYYSPAVINDELQFYSPNAFSLSSGILSINAVKTTTNANGMEYTSGVLTSLDKFSQAYGYFELRAKLPKGAGFWPAFWLLNQNLAWPPEIDIFEFLGHEMEIPKHTLHYNDTTGTHQSEHDYPLTQDLSDAWHTYGLLWEAGRLVFYIDNVETGRIERPEVPSLPCYIIFNNTVGGSWPGAPNKRRFPTACRSITCASIGTIRPGLIRASRVPRRASRIRRIRPNPQASVSILPTPNSRLPRQRPAAR
jgi:beta-glucanase (GH16 family)